MPKHARRPLFFRHTAMLLLLCGLLAAAFPLFAEQDTAHVEAPSSHPIALEWLLDTAGTRTLSAVLAPESAQLFEPVPEDGFPDAAGTVWLRFALPALTGEPCLDLNERLAGQLPSGVEAWIVRRPSGNAAGASPEALPELVSGLYLLPKVPDANAMIYLKVPGVPSPGFIPAIRERDTVSTLGLDGLFWPQIGMGLLLALCLIRGVTERREWRLLSGLYLAAALVALTWGVPGTPGGLPDPQSLPGLLAPGIALLLLPHAGRQMMQTQDTAPNLDLALSSVGIAGLLLALTPLVPHAEGFVRLLALWPLGMLLCWPIAFIALLRRIPGSRVFALAVLLPPLGFLPLWFNISGNPDFIKLLPFLTACLSALGLALLPSPRHPSRAVQRRVGTPAQPGDGAQTSTLVIQDLSAPRPEVPATDPLTERLNTLNKELNTLFDHPLQPALRMRVRLLADALTNGMRTASGSTVQPTNFSLHEVILEAHNAVSATAERQNLALTWYVAPQLSRQYLGDRTTLTRTLTELLASAIRATERGSVQLRAQRLPESNDPGLLLFSIADTGAGASPDKRDPVALLHAWELAGSLGGSLGLTSGPTGTTVSFVIRLQPAAETSPVPETDRQPELKAALSSALRVLIVSDVPASRQLLAYYLDELPHELHEARSTGEALTMYAQAPGALIILDGDLPEEDLVRFIAQLRAFEGEHALPPSSILGLTGSEAQAEQLRRAGCTHTLSRPVQRTELRHMVLRLAPMPRQRSAVPRPRTEKSKPDGKRKLSATSITLDPSVENDGWLLLPEHDALKKERLAPRDEVSQPDASDSVRTATPSSGSDEAQLRFLQPPTLNVRSNVGEPMPLSKPTTTGEGKSRSSTDNEACSPDGTMASDSDLATDTGNTPASDKAEGGNVSVPPIKPVRIQAVSRIPASDNNAPRPRSMRAVPYQPGNTTSSLSPWTGDRGDWVGDPMPIGTPAAAQDAGSTNTETAVMEASGQPNQDAPSAAQIVPDQAAPIQATAVQAIPSVAKPSRYLAGGTESVGNPVAPNTQPASLTSSQKDTLLPAAGTAKKQGLFGKLTGLLGNRKPAPTEDLTLPPYASVDHRASEWVGEPMPIDKKESTPAQSTPPQQESDASTISAPATSDASIPEEPIELTDPVGQNSKLQQSAPQTPASSMVAMAVSLTHSDEKASQSETPIELTDPVGQEAMPARTALPKLFPTDNGTAHFVMPLPHMSEQPHRSSQTGAFPPPADDTLKAASTDAPIELTEPIVGQEARPSFTPLPELFPAGPSTSATVMTLPYASDALRPTQHGPDTPPNEQVASPANKALANEPLSLGIQLPSGMPPLAVVEPLTTPSYVTENEDGDALELTDRIAPELPELRLSPATPQEDPLSRHSETEPLHDDGVPPLRTETLSPLDSQPTEPPLPPLDHLEKGLLPAGEPGEPLPAAPDVPSLSATPGVPAQDTVLRPEALSPIHEEPYPHVAPERKEPLPPDSDSTAKPLAESVTQTVLETAQATDDAVAYDPAEDVDVASLLNTLDTLEHALQEAALRNDIPALRDVSNTIANTADTLRMPTLADLAHCLAESDDENRESLLEATLKATHQARQ